ncbi:MAG TPA: hypothetical protein VHY35_20410 [Stellaceae bacterium]|jgi:biotin carboxylase|nr:hypothetical protein [Stellaceae bacterium]
MNGLMVAFAFSLPYHVLRTATAAGLRVHVLGSGPSRGLRTSRCCASFSKSTSTGNGENDSEILLAEIRDLARRRRIDIILPSDDVSTRLLATIKDRLPVRTTLLPDLATFDLLNDKWNFCRFARDNGVRIPETSLYSSAVEIRRLLRSGKLSLPLTLKPLNRSGGIGVVHICDERDLTQLDAIDYSPILIQRHIVGPTVGIAALCRRGKIVMHSTQWYDDRRFRLFASPDLVADAEKIAAATGLDSTIHFDAILEASTGLSYIVECNPRFWFTIYMPMILGLNFVECAFDEAQWQQAAPATLADAEVCRSVWETIRHPRRASRQDWAYLAYQWGDPLAYLFQRCKIFDDRNVAVEAQRMHRYHPPESAPLANALPMRVI